MARDAGWLAGRARRIAAEAGHARGMLRVTIEDDSAANRRGVDRIFDALDATVADFPGVLEAAVPAIKRAHARVFATEGAAGRGAWPALSPVTLEERARLGFAPGPILHRTGALRAHVLGTPAEITRHGHDVTLRITPDRNVNGVPKYRALAKGNPATNLPGRPMVAIGPAGARAVTSAIQRALRAAAARHGL